jgi:uncharacterized protein YndB with AHSA1/START domain
VTGTRHVFETYVRATPDRVWAALTDPAFTRQFFFGLAVNAGWEAGGAYRYDGADGPALAGTIEVCEPPHRLVMTFTVLFDAEAAAEPPSRVTWELTPVGDTTRVTCIHADLALSPATWRLTASGWSIVLSGLKTLVETGTPLGDVPDDGGSPFSPAATSADVETDWHRRSGRECNNAVYGLLDRTDRSADDDARMIHTAHAAAYHWGIAGGPTHAARAEYLLGRVYAFVGRAEPALFHAARCLAAVESAGLDDFDRAFAHEAMARALACAGRPDDAATHLAAARATPVADPEDAAIVTADLEAGPWYGLAV